MSQKPKTVGAVSGYFPSAAERAANEQIRQASAAGQVAAMGYEAQRAEMAAGPACTGHCAACGQSLYGSACPRCEANRNDPTMILHDGRWTWRCECHGIAYYDCPDEA